MGKTREHAGEGQLANYGSGGNLRRVPHGRGLSQDDLAYEAEISRSYLSQIEKGVFHVSLGIIGKLATALQVELAEFLKAQPAKVQKSTRHNTRS